MATAAHARNSTTLTDAITAGSTVLPRITLRMMPLGRIPAALPDLANGHHQYESGFIRTAPCRAWRRSPTQVDSGTGISPALHTGLGGPIKAFGGRKQPHKETSL